ncbi:MAG TPA: hypothetical protein VG103_04535 [Chthoniobacterales bacterium]|nr:hypothetical protein [Chthoniobacterales bacterium]
MKDALISGGTSLAIWGAVFLTTFLLHLLYYTPKHNVAELKADRDNVRRQLDSAYDLKTKRCMEVRENMFQRCMEMLKSPEPMLPFHVVVRHEAYNLEDNDDVSWLCDEIGKTSYGHPFAGLDLYVPRSDRKEFLRWIRLFTDYDAISGDTTDYLDAAEEWRHNHGYPEPPAEVRIARLFDKRLRPE